MLMFVLHAGVLMAQEGDRPSLLLAPWQGSAAPNMAAEMRAHLRSGLDSLALFDRVEWNALVDSSRMTREMSEGRREKLDCLQARQLAGVEDIEYVLCGGVSLTPEGFLLELELYEVASGVMEIASVVAENREALVERALARVREWGMDLLALPHELEVPYPAGVGPKATDLPPWSTFDSQVDTPSRDLIGRGSGEGDSGARTHREDQPVP